MTSGLAGFDDRLNEVLAQQADKNGETVDAYVRRAVVTRLVKELADDGDSDLGRMLRSMRDAQDAAPTDASAGGTDTADTTDDADGDIPFDSVIRDAARLQALRNTGLLDTPPDPKYDRLVAMAAEALGVPIAAVSLVDDRRQFFKAAVGLGDGEDRLTEMPVGRSVCRYAVESGQPLVVEDARTDELFADHPGVLDKTWVSYLGIPLVDDGGHALGTLCVWDQQPRQWTTGHIQILKDLAWIVRERILD